MRSLVRASTTRGALGAPLSSSFSTRAAGAVLIVPRVSRSGLPGCMGGIASPGLATTTPVPATSSSCSLLPLPYAQLWWTQRACYAKGAKGGKGKKDSDEDSGPQVSVTELTAQTKDSLSSQMKRSVDWLTEEFSKLRVGRANTEILNRVKVEGAPLAKKGSVFVKDSFTLAITPFEKDQTKKIIDALRDSDLDLSPQTDGENIIVRLPKATDEYRQSLLKQANKLTEDVKNSIRRTRQNVLTDLKRYKDSISKDDMKKLENEVQKATDEYTKKAEQLLKTKEQAISGP